MTCLHGAAYNTVVSYIERLADCFFIYKAPRFDVRGGEHLKLINKYYLTDFGFKYYILNNPTLELQQLGEDVVYLELLRWHRLWSPHCHPTYKKLAVPLCDLPCLCAKKGVLTAGRRRAGRELVRESGLGDFEKRPPFPCAK